MPLTDLPCVPESRLPAELAAQLPDATPPAPWPCRVRAVLWVQRAESPLPAASPFSGRTRTVEAFVLDTEADLYGQHVAVDFVARLRGMERYDSIDELLVAMATDTANTRRVLGGE